MTTPSNTQDPKDTILPVVLHIFAAAEELVHARLVGTLSGACTSMDGTVASSISQAASDLVELLSTREQKYRVRIQNLLQCVDMLENELEDVIDKQDQAQRELVDVHQQLIDVEQMLFGKEEEGEEIEKYRDIVGFEWVEGPGEVEGFEWIGPEEIEEP